VEEFRVVEAIVKFRRFLTSTRCESFVKNIPWEWINNFIFSDCEEFGSMVHRCSLSIEDFGSLRPDEQMAVEAERKLLKMVAKKIRVCLGLFKFWCLDLFRFWCVFSG